MKKLEEWSALPDGVTFLHEKGLVPSLVNCLLLESIHVSDKAAQILLEVTKYSQTAQVCGVLAVLQQAFRKEPTSEQVLRFLALFAHIGGQNPQNFELCKSQGAYKLIFEAFNNDDVLELLNVIEVLEIVGSTPDGMAYLIEAGIMGKVLENVAAEDDNAGGLFRDKIISSLTSLARKDAIQNTLYKAPVVTALQTCWNREENSGHEGIVTCVGAVGSSTLGLDQLFAHKEFFDAVLQQLYYPGLPTRICILSAFAEILEKRKSTTENEIDQLKTAFDHMGEEGGESVPLLLLSLLKGPFWELRQAVYAVVKGLCRYKWGLEAITRTGGFFSHLLARTTESEAEGLRWKFVILETVVAFPEVKGIVGNETFYDAVEYLKKGVVFSKHEAVPILKDETF